MELRLPDNTDARELLTAQLDVRPGPATRAVATYYDTFDGRLHADGVTLRHKEGRLTLLDRETGDELAAAESTAAKRFFDFELPEPLKARLADVIEMRALLPVARRRAERRAFAVLNEDAKTVVRLYAENGRLTVTPVKGYEAELDRVRETLNLEEATVPLVDELIAAEGNDPAGTSSKLALKLDPEQPANQAAARVFTRLLEVIDLNLPGTLDDIDTEFVHDLRVAVRRTRSLQRQFKSIYPDALQHHRDEFKRLQAVTSDLRDLDVYLLDFPDLRASLPEKMQADLDPLRGVLETRRARALTATRRALRAQRTGDALADWNAFVTHQKPSEQTVKQLASQRITKVYGQMVKMGKAIDDDSPAEDLHELRKVGKELRYLLEFFASLYPAEIVKPFVKTLKGLQDQLGRFQDREVQANALRDLAPTVESHPSTLMAMGVLVERFMQEEIAARAEFAERFEVFASSEQRAVVKEYFA